MTLRDFAVSMLENNPSFSQNPVAQEYISVIKSNDSAKGEQIAQNLCNSYGVNKEDALNQARKFFGFGS